MNTLTRITILFIIGISCISASAFASETLTCESDKVKVCFADGECICKERQIQPTDPVPQISTCVDENDDGACE